MGICVLSKSLLFHLMFLLSYCNKILNNKKYKKILNKIINIVFLFDTPCAF